MQVGYLATKFNDSVILAHDFAIGGHTVQGVEYQINERFLHHAAKKPTWAPWTEDNSIFCTSSGGKKWLMYSYLDWNQ